MTVERIDRRSVEATDAARNGTGGAGLFLFGRPVSGLAPLLAVFPDGVLDDGADGFRAGHDGRAHGGDPAASGERQTGPEGR